MKQWINVSKRMAEIKAMHLLVTNFSNLFELEFEESLDLILKVEELGIDKIDATIAVIEKAQKEGRNLSSTELELVNFTANSIGLTTDDLLTPLEE